MFSILAMLFTIVAFFSTAAGGYVALRYRRDLVLFMAYAAGALLGIAFFDLFPESIRIIIGSGVTDQYLLYAMYVLVMGFLYYHLLQRSLVIHSHSKSIHPVGQGSHADISAIGPVAAMSLSIHSALDGFAIGIGFQIPKIGLEVGLFIATAVVLHDFSDGLNTVTVMLRSGSSAKSAFRFLLTDAIAPIIGALVSFVFEIPTLGLALLLAFFAGEFLSIGATDLLPEADHKETSWRILLFTLFGAVFIFLLVNLANILHAP